MIRFLLGVILAKAGIMSVTVFAVITSHLPVFVKTLIIAAVSATVTGFFTLLAAVLASRIAANAARSLQGDVHDVKRHLDLTKRETDTVE